MSLVNASTAWHCIARLDTEIKQAWEADPRIGTLRRQTKVLLSECLAGENTEGSQQRCVATITWSCAKLKLHDADMMSALGDLAVRWLWSFKPLELANVLWGLAKLQVEQTILFQLAHDCILSSLKLFPTRSLSMAAWAFATVRFDACQGLLCKMADAFVAGLASGDDANPVTIANMVWALAITRTDVSREVLQAMGTVATAELDSFKVHELSVMLWAFARLNACHEGLFARAMGLLCRNQRLREEIHSQGIANLLWAIARYSKDVRDSGAHMSLDVLAALLPTLTRLLPKLSSVEISSSVWAISKLVPCWGQHPAVDRILVEAAKSLLAEPQLLKGMSSHGAASLLSAYSDFFCSSPCAPQPCQELVAQLVEFCASFPQDACAAQVHAKAVSGAGSHESADWRGWRLMGANAARELTDGDAVVEPVQGVPGLAPPPPSGRVPAGLRSVRLASGAPQTQANMPRQRAAGELACVHPGFDTAEASAQAGVSGQPQRELPSTMDVQLSWQVPRYLPEVGSKLQAPQAPAIVIVEEFTSRNEDLRENQLVDVAVEVADNEVNKAACIVVDIFANFGKQDSFVLQAEDADAFGMYKLRMPQYEGRWAVSFTLMSIWGKAIGKPASISYLSKPSVMRLKPEDYLSTASSSCTNTGADRSTCTGSTHSDFSDSDHDQEAEAPIVRQRAM